MGPKRTHLGLGWDPVFLRGHRRLILATAVSPIAYSPQAVKTSSPLPFFAYSVFATPYELASEALDARRLRNL